MRTITKPTTAKCNIQMYMMYLISDPLGTSCTRLSEIMNDVSHDSINRFLERENFNPEDMYREVSQMIDVNGGTLSVDDTVLDKPYSDPKKAELVGYFWSGKHHNVAKGINVITLFYTDMNKVRAPVNYRIINKKEGKTKNEHYLEMLDEVLEWGLEPTWMTGDSWYSSLKNLKQGQKKELNLLFGVESNRLVSIEKGEWVQIQSLEDWTEDGKEVYLKDFGTVKVFKQTRKNVSRYYVVSVPKTSQLNSIGKLCFELIHSQHWGIECFHRAIKQVCNIERFQVRTSRSIKTHIYCSIRAFIFLECLAFKNVIGNWYQIKRTLFIKVLREFILNSDDIIHNLNIMPPVNA